MVAADSCGIASATALHYAIAVRASGAQSGPQSYNRAGDKSSGHGVNKYPPVKPEIQANGKSGRWKERGNGPAGPHAYGQSAEAAEKREQDALGEHLTDQAPAARTHGRADGHFALAHGRAHQQNIGYVHAGQKQDQSLQRQKYAGDERNNIVGKGLRPRQSFGDHADGYSLVGRGILLCQPLRYYVQRTLRLLQANARFQPG